MATMPRDRTARFYLRAATADAHDRVDAAFSRFDLADRDAYGAFLMAQAGALLPLEHAVDALASQRLADWQVRRRSPHLLDDLASLSLTAPVSAALPPVEREAEMWGALYVIEGSRLGGALLKRSVPADWPATFLTPAPGNRWRTFLEALENALTTEGSRQEALAGALRAFELFERSGLAAVQRAA